jgi:SPOR domain
MADRYQSKPFPADDDYDRGEESHAASARGEGDPLAVLARLIGQTDPLSGMSRANLRAQPGAGARDQYQQPAAFEPDSGPPTTPPWMQHAARHETPQQDYPEDYQNSVHPVQRYATTYAAPEPDYQQAPPLTDSDDHESDPARYDDVLYGRMEPGAEQVPHDQAYTDDPYYHGRDDVEGHVLQKRRGGTITIVVVLALAVVGTAAAFAYRTYFGSPRSGEPPIIRADAGPTKIVPTPSDGINKVPDRLTAGDGAERLVSREETPVDISPKSSSRVVFPSQNLNANAPAATIPAPTAPSAGAGNGTLSNGEPRKIKTFTVRGDQPDSAAAPTSSTGSTPPPPVRTAAAAPSATPRSATANANASSARAPLSLSPQAPRAAPAPDTQTRVAAVAPVQIAPSGGGGGGYLVQVSSQRNESDAQASYRALQGKFPAVLGSHSPLIKRADLGEKGVYYRAMVGPFGSSEEATQLCGSLKAAGGQCVVQRN